MGSIKDLYRMIMDASVSQRGSEALGMEGAEIWVESLGNAANKIQYLSC